MSCQCAILAKGKYSALTAFRVSAEQFAHHPASMLATVTVPLEVLSYWMDIWRSHILLSTLKLCQNFYEPIFCVCKFVIIKIVLVSFYILVRDKVNVQTAKTMQVGVGVGANTSTGEWHDSSRSCPNHRTRRTLSHHSASVVWICCDSRCTSSSMLVMN